ncbi:lipopolysaccharide heptosyltransferase I [Thiomicrorhabdus sp.]|uniref:lipopolysaccharide heptosyltransferase I n=1 Tax=Thiomicrorhabdus sp. TaxID=2039724 RepID=UPI0029C8ADC7|nr:lipopolysaccharide heptosyltransferase I [Thiomicrorhabdus sp.]
MKASDSAKRVLVVKMSSFGDIIHTFPALQDAAEHFPGITFDWVVEAPFQRLPKLSKHVDRVIVSGRRQWRKHRLSVKTIREQRAFYRELRQVRYDAVIEVQYTRKGAKVVKKALGRKYGLDAKAANDADIAKSFDQAFFVSKSLPAIERSRKLFALALGYSECKNLDFGLENVARSSHLFPQPFLVFIMSTTWATKHAPPKLWIELLAKARKDGYRVLIPWLSPSEKQLAQEMIKQAGWGEVLPEPVEADEWAKIMQDSRGTIGVDTGLLHLSGALDKPTVGIFGPTNPFLTGVRGKFAENIYESVPCGPCMARTCGHSLGQICFDWMSAERVWTAFNSQMALCVDSTGL